MKRIYTVHLSDVHFESPGHRKSASTNIASVFAFQINFWEYNKFMNEQ